MSYIGYSSLYTSAPATLHVCEPRRVALVVPISLNSIMVHRQQHVGVALHASTSSPLLSHDSSDVHHRQRPVSAQEASTDVGTALHSPTVSPLSPQLTALAILSAKNVRRIGFHLRIHWRTPRFHRICPLTPLWHPWLCFLGSSSHSCAKRAPVRRRCRRTRVYCESPFSIFSG